jgi:hypothetical protein
MTKNVRKRNKDEKLKNSAHQLIKKVVYEKMQKKCANDFPLYSGENSCLSQESSVPST